LRLALKLDDNVLRLEVREPKLAVALVARSFDADASPNAERFVPAGRSHVTVVLSRLATQLGARLGFARYPNRNWSEW